MPNKKINALDVRTAVSTDLMLVGDPATGTAYKSTLATLPLVPTSRTITINGVSQDLSANRTYTIDALPSQTGNSGKYLTTNGTAASWGVISTDNIYTANGTLTSARTLTSGGFPLTFTGSNTAASAIAIGLNLTHTLVASANSDVLVGLDINPTFTNGAFTNVRNAGVRVKTDNYNFVAEASTTGAFYTGYNVRNTIGKTGILMIGSSGDGSGHANATVLASIDGNLNLCAGFDASSGGAYFMRFATGGYSMPLAERMRITAAGRVLINRTSEDIYVLDVNGAQRLIGDTTIQNTGVARLSFTNLTTSASWLFENHRGAPSGSLEITNIAGTAGLTLFSTRNVGINTNTDAGFKLDVNGTARVSDNLTVSKNQNAVTSLQISNTNSGSGSQVSFQLFSDSLSGGSSLSKVSSTATPYKVITASDSSFYNSTAGDITFLNDVTTGKLKFATGGVSTAQMTLTAAGRLLLGTTTEGTNLLDVNGGVNITGNATIVGNLTVDTNTLFVDATNNRVGVGNTTPLSNIDVRQTSTNKNGIWITGAEYTNPAVGNDANNGIAIILGVNRSANRQVWIGSSEVIGSASLGLIRLQTGTNIPSIDGVTGNGSTRLNLNIGSATSNVLIGQPDGNTTLPASCLSVARNFSVGSNYFGTSAPTNGAIIEGSVIIGSTTNIASALLNVTSTTQGFLPPRMTTTQINAIATPANGLMAYNTDLSVVCFYDGTNWKKVSHSNM